MSDLFKKTYTVAGPGCGLTVFSMEGSEIELFGSHTVISTSAEDFFEPIKDFLHEKFVEEKADTMYYISMVDTVVLTVLAGVAIVGGVIATFASCGAATPLLGLGCVLAGAAVSSYSYMKTLDRDRTIGRERSWLQFYADRMENDFKGVVGGAAVFIGIYSIAGSIGTAGGLLSSIPSIMKMNTLGGAAAGAVEVTAAGAMVMGLSGTTALIAAALQSGKGGGSEEGVHFKGKEDASVEDLVKKVPKKYKEYGKCDKFKDKLHDLLEKNNIEHDIIKIENKETQYICSKKYGGEIGETGYHYGIRVGDIVYDNLTPEGMNYNAWLQDLYYYDWEGALEVLINP